MPEEYDLDLRSIQEARRLVVQCREAQRVFFRFDQKEVDQVVEAMAEAAYCQAGRLAQLAHEETGYGVVAHKTLKNQFNSRILWEAIKDQKTVGVVRRDDSRRIIEIAWPFGVIAALTPVTNPTATVINNAIIAVKARNGIVFAPHPAAAKCSAEATRVVAEAAEAMGAPEGLISCMTHITLPGTNELMGHWAVDLILATGGTEMVRAAHGVGKPAIGVGPGNTPVYVDRSADVEKAARDTVNGKSFDCGVVCSTEQSVVADKPIADQLAAAMERHGAVFIGEATANILRKELFRPTGIMYPQFVGQTPQALGRMLGFSAPEHARILVARLSEVGPEEPLSREKLTTILSFYVEDGWRRGCDRCIQVLKFGGEGHTLGIHCRDEEVIMAFGLEKPAFRIIVNSTTTLGAVGYTTGLDPAFTLATGGLGGSIVSDNITVRHLMNLKRVAYELRSYEPPEEAAKPAAVGEAETAADIEAIVRRVLMEELACRS